MQHLRRERAVKPLGHRLAHSIGPGHQRCGTCHPALKSGAVRSRQQARQIEREAMQHAFDLVFSGGSAQLAQEAEDLCDWGLESIASETESRGTL
jgi:hypothetical protein